MTNSKTERYKIAKVIEDYPSKWKVLLKWAIIQMKIGHYTDIHSIKFFWNYATQVHSCYPTCSVPFFNIYIMKANIHLKEHFYLGRGLPHTYHSSLMITPPSKERVAKGVYVTLCGRQILQIGKVNWDHNFPFLIFEVSTLIKGQVVCEFF